MKKRFSAGTKMAAASLALAMSIPGVAAAADQPKDALIPVRAVGEAVGADVRWEEGAQRVTVNKGEKTFQITLGSAAAQVNGQAVTLAENVQLLNGRTQVPLSLINQAFGMNIKWDHAQNKPAIGDMKGFEAQSVPNGSKGTYDLTLNLSEEGRFSTTAKIDVENASSDAWKEIVFDLVPNAFTDQNKTPDLQGSAEVKIVSVQVNGTDALYSEDSNLLSLALQEELQPGESASVEIRYEFTVPTPGYRFAENKGSYFLAEWYPMLQTYHNGWNRNKYWKVGESYHSDFSDYTLHYNLPPGYQLVSSAESDAPIGSSSGTIQAEKMKEVFIAVTKGMKMVSKMVDGVEVRLWAKEDDTRVDAMLELATDSFDYYNKTIGRYPYKQLDVVLARGEIGMEYSGLTTNGEDGEDLMFEVVHEVAHQWFYGVVSNNPYTDGWVDESLTEFASSLYRHDRKGMAAEDAAILLKIWYDMAGGVPEVSNLPNREYKDNAFMHAYVYGQPGLKLWDLMFNHYGGKEEARRFLSTYYQTYAFKQVDTAEFVRFMKHYFPLDDTFFTSWLKLK